MEKEFLLRGESRNLEYKQEVPQNSLKYMKSVVAFANGDGGRIVFGIEDEPRKVIGIPQEDIFQLMDSITNAITDSCEPMIVPNLMVQEVDDKQLIILEIAPGILANAFAYMNLIEKWGSGFPRILYECREYGLKEPEVIDFSGDLRINLRSCKKKNICNE